MLNRLKYIPLVLLSLSLSANVRFSTVANADDHYSADVVSKSVKFSSPAFQSDQEATFDLSTPLYKITIERKWVRELVPVVVCDSDEGSESASWKRFFNAPNTQKPSLLADAIKGIGANTAKRLVDDHYFSRKPRTWKAFSDIISQADKVYQTGFSYDVLVKYSKENMISLGFKAGDPSCEVKYEYQWVMREFENKEFVKTLHKNFRVNVSNLILFKGESDSLDVSWDGFKVWSNDGSLTFNHVICRWSDEGSNSMASCEAKRLQRSPLNQLNLLTSKADTSMNITIEDMGFDAENESKMGLAFVEIEIRQSITFWPDKTLKKFVAPLARSGSETVLKDVIKLSKGTKYYINYRIKREESPYFSSGFSSNKQTKVLQF